MLGAADSGRDCQLVVYKSIRVTHFDNHRLTNEEEGVFGQRLRLARKRAGLSMRELADAMSPKVTAQAISKYEAGKMLPSSTVLIGLGRVLDVSLDFLMSAEIEVLEAVEFRRHPGASARDRARAEAAVMDRLERYLAIEHILNIRNKADWVERLRCDSVASESQIDEQANELRRIWDLGLGPIPSMCELLEKRGIKVVEADLPETINGLSCRALRGGEIIAEAVVMSRRINVESKRFTLAHELAHRLIRSTGNPAINLGRAMNRFACAFLIPGQCLREELGADRQRITHHEIFRLKHIYGVSAAALLIRLGQVGVISESSVNRAFATFARSWRKSEPEPIQPGHGFAAFEKPLRFKRLVWRAVGEELISLSRAAELFDQSRESVERQFTGPAVR